MKPYRLKLVREKDDSLPEGRALNPLMTADYLRKNIFNDDEGWREKAFLLTLDKSKNITGVFHVSTGGMDHTSIDPHLIAIISVQAGAHSVILAHNHPGGNPTPGKNDIEMTRKCKNSLNAVSTSLTDHIVIGEETFYSFDLERIQKYPECHA